jgi:hypothetical protein
LCFGQCSNASHEIAAMAALVMVTHDENGLPFFWEVVESSGDRDFDAEALSAVKTTLAQNTGNALMVDPAPVSSRWLFSTQAYRWSRDELLLDPQFTPPGREVESASGVLGKTTVVRSVRLVAVTYRAKSK